MLFPPRADIPCRRGVQLAHATGSPELPGPRPSARSSARSTRRHPSLSMDFGRRRLVEHRATNSLARYSDARPRAVAICSSHGSNCFPFGCIHSRESLRRAFLCSRARLYMVKWRKYPLDSELSSRSKKTPVRSVRHGPIPCPWALKRRRTAGARDQVGRPSGSKPAGQRPLIAARLRIPASRTIDRRVSLPSSILPHSP